MNKLLQSTINVDEFKVNGPLLLNYPLVQEQSEQGRRQLFTDAISRLVYALKAKDLHLYRHCYRVQQLTHFLTKSLNLPSGLVARMHTAALFHDIGKLSISNKLLHKVSSLTRQEFEQIKKHPTQGAMILNRQGIFEGVVPMVQFHHEHWNGYGYPHGLQGQAIPLGARIIAIADAFEVMTSTCRPYQKQRTPLEALAELRRCAGTQFDPNLVDIFCTHWQGDLQTLAD
ncbi:MAG TPA: HD-GYP domain-containing protein [Ktedonobacteraceae bacterium]|jgi:putative two-component system response regulator|nr:HD-GYP domain-containing protein [Ktedonobacteraceae bacterium]